MKQTKPTIPIGTTRVEAFTLTEIVTVMIITGILLTIVYGAFRAVGQRYQVFARSAHVQTEVSLLNNLLHKDIERAYLLQTSPQHLTIQFADPQIQAIDYQFLDSSIVRTQQTITDTFHLAPDSLAFYWQKNLLPPSGRIADEVFFLGKTLGESYIFHAHKTYDYQTRWLLEKNE